MTCERCALIVVLLRGARCVLLLSVVLSCVLCAVLCCIMAGC